MPFSAEAGAATRPAPRWWMAVAAALLLGSVAARGFPPVLLDWQPMLAWREPWRAWTAAWVHYSALHLLANLVGALVVAAFGVVARVPRTAALAWLAAWPLTQFGLVARPDLAHYGGLSGVLHAGVAVVAFQLLLSARGARRAVGAAVLAMLAAKVASEVPWGPALRQPPGWDIDVAPFAHLSGLVAGTLAGVVVRAVAAAARRAEIWPLRRSALDRSPSVD